jgi:hypothetical protein
MSQDPTGGWLKPANHELLLGWMCASEHPTFDDRTFRLFIIQEEINGIWAASSLSHPYEIVWQSDGMVRVQEYLPSTVQRKPIFAGESDGFDSWLRRRGDWEVENGLLSSNPSDQADQLLMNTLWGHDLTMMAEISATADSEAAFMIRANPSGSAGYRISLDFARQQVRLLRLFPGEPDQLLQARAVALSGDHWHRLKVIVQGKFFEIYVDDNLSIVRDHRLYDSGCFGLQARGDVQFRQVRVYEDVELESAVTDWQIHCKPRHLQP